jgi:hypothetical protein
MVTRKERIALNEAMFREGNERMSAWPERRDAPSTEKLSFFCECADPDCRGHVSLTMSEYEAVRQDPMHFAIVSGHEIRDAERVIERHEDFAVIEKHEDVRPIAEGRDRRGE